MHISKYICGIIISMWIACAYCGDISNWYYASDMPPEPRFDHPWLCEGSLQLTGGSSDFSYDAYGAQQPLYDIFGRHNPRTWAQELPDVDPTQRDIDSVITQLQSPATPVITAHGEFDLLQIDITYTLNLDYGWFVRWHIPFRELAFSHVNIQPERDTGTREKARLIEDNLDALLARMGYTATTRTSTSIGDMSLICGYTNTYDATEYIDFVDTTLACGVLLPSGPIADLQTVFDLPHGQDNRTAWIFHYVGAYGIYDWLTCGWFARAMLFAPTQEPRRVHTHPDGRGWITPNIVTTHIRSGHLWHVGMYGKADHILLGLSMQFGYSYQRKEDADIHPCNEDARPDVQIAQDQRFAGWSQHTFHWNITYDFATRHAPYAPEVSIFCNHIIDGRHVFESSTGGFHVACNLSFYD